MRSKAQQPEWIVATAKPLQHQRAIDNIRRQDHPCYCPMTWDPRTKRRVPLFGPYLFVGIFEEWYFLRSTFGVANVLTVCGFPHIVPAREIERFKSLENDNGNVVLPDDAPPAQEIWTKGDPVRVLSGPFEACIGVYQSTAGKDRMRILLDFLNSHVPATLERWRVARVAA